MKKSYKIFWILLIVLIPLVPLSGLNYSIDVSDVGFNLNQYKFCFSDIDSTYLPLFLTNLIGGALLSVFEIFGIPAYLGMELAWAAVCWYLCFLSYRLYKRYCGEARMLLTALALAMLFAKCNFHFYIYNTAVALMALTGLYFLIRAVNDEKPWLLSFASAFFTLAAFCKISSLIQFAVFAVLFYDLYKKRDRRYFVRQLLYCVLGVVCAAAFGAVLMQLTCGVGEYLQMIADMFLYAGNSNDGHTIGNMIAINLKGTMRGALLLAALWLIYLLAKKVRRIEPVVRYGVPAAAVVLLIGKLAGLDALPVADSVYGILGDYLNGVSVAVMMIYVCAVLIFLDKECSYEFKILAVCAGALTVIMPIGSNVGITHICNEFFMALPYIAIYVDKRVCKARAQGEEQGRTAGEEQGSRAHVPGEEQGSRATAPAEQGFWKKFPSAGNVLTLVCAAWCVLLAASQSLYMTKAYLKDGEPMKQFSLADLRGIKYDSDIVDSMEEVVEFIKANTTEGQTMVTCGAVPILHFLTDVPPYIDGCGGWIETDYVTAEGIAEELAAAEEYPVVVFKSTALEERNDKTTVVIQFVNDNGYEQVFANGEYEVYICRAE